MSMRNLTRAEGNCYFLVKYLCDNKIQVRSMKQVRSEEPINTGSVYLTQWGSQSQCDYATILASGTKVEMRAKLRDECPPAPKAKKQKVHNYAQGRKMAWLIAVGQGQAAPVASAPASVSAAPVPLSASAFESSAPVEALTTLATTATPVTNTDQVAPTPMVTTATSVTNADQLAPSSMITTATWVTNADQIVPFPMVTTSVPDSFSETPQRRPSFRLQRPGHYDGIIHAILSALENNRQQSKRMDALERNLAEISRNLRDFRVVLDSLVAVRNLKRTSQD